MQINAGSTLCGAQPVVVDGQVPEHERDGRGAAAQRRKHPDDVQLQPTDTHPSAVVIEKSGDDCCDARQLYGEQ